MFDPVTITVDVEFQEETGEWLADAKRIEGIKDKIDKSMMEKVKLTNAVEVLIETISL